ncbi:hypothetical protein Nepgr_029008 [Nepenthes gracilis]|uniref:Uncharacterized protein n=1 Tax=Nepenthes gracilis TaxID=150966 RepID=A0AAD3Y4G6_NEPGR|nr:hypothetical protein Nepgr_029008 [Nepenthes gracilis]
MFSCCWLHSVEIQSLILLSPRVRIWRSGDSPSREGYSPPRQGHSPPMRGYSPPRQGYGSHGRRKEQKNGSLLVWNIPLDCRPEELQVDSKCSMFMLLIKSFDIQKRGIVCGP